MSSAQPARLHGSAGCPALEVTRHRTTMHQAPTARAPLVWLLLVALAWFCCAPAATAQPAATPAQPPGAGGPAPAAPARPPATPKARAAGPPAARPPAARPPAARPPAAGPPAAGPAPPGPPAGGGTAPAAASSEPGGAERGEPGAASTEPASTEPAGAGQPGLGAAHAQQIEDETELARGLPVVKIRVAGQRRLTEQEVLTYLQLKVGQLFSPETLSQDVRELWRSGFFDDIEVDLERGDAGVRLRLLVRERPNIVKVEFEGNDVIDDDDLKEAIEIKEGSIISHPSVGRSIQKIRDMYAERGYFLAEATSQITPEKNNEVRVRFTITEHNEVTVRRVTFIGNKAIPSEELRATMIVGNTGMLSLGSGGPFRQDAFERDIAVISALYYDRGYLTVSISTPRVMLTPDRSGIEISITIDEGPRFKIRQLRVYERGADGREVEPIGGRRKLRRMLRAESGDYFNRAALLEDLQAIRTLYRDEGYAFVEANPDTKLDAARQEVDVVIPIVRGPLVHIERIEISGNTKTRDKVIRREMEIEEGQLFSESKIARSKQRITALGYFERVDDSTQRGTAEDRLRLIFEVSERPTGTFQIGAGFSSIENFIATAQVQQTNLFGNGQSLSLNAQVSGIRQMVNVRLYEPYFLDSQFQFSIDLYDQLRVYDSFSQSSLGGALTWGYPLIAPELAASVTYTLEQNDVSTQSTSTLLGTAAAVSVFRRLPLANLFNAGITSSVRPALTYDTRNDRMFPSSGIYLRGSTELAVAEIGSHTEFWRHRFTGRYFYPVAPNVVLKANTEAGLVTSPSSAGVPIFARFFLGGIMDVRGFRFRTLGPRMPLTQSTDPNSNPIANGANIGGNLMYYQNIEFEFPIVQAVGIRGVLFTDAGNAWNLEDVYCKTGGTGIPYKETNPCFSFPSSLTNIRASYGFGLRWFSPMGPLRFEWGFPFSHLPYEESNRFEFTIGNFF